MARKTVHIPLTLPDDPHGPATFIHTIEQRLSNRPGIYSVRIVPTHGQTADPNHQATIELDYNPDLLSLAQIDRNIQQAGGSLSKSIGHLVLPIKGMISPQSQHVIEAVLNKLPGVTASVSFASQSLRVEFDRNQCALPEIARRLDHLGMQLGADRTGVSGVSGPPDSGIHALKLPGWVQVILSQRDLTLSIVGGILLLAGLAAHLAGGLEWLRLALLTGSYVCCGWYTAPDVAKALRHLHLDIDVLMLAAAFGAAYLGHYEEGALLLLLFSLGNAGQRLAMNRARSAIQALAELAPQTATLIENDNQREVRIEDLRVGNLVLVQPGQQIPADGQIESGLSTVDQSPITGESMPVDKSPEDNVYAGTINGEGALTIRVNKLASDNTIAKVIRLVEEAQTTKSPTQLFTDRIERWYVPTVMLTTVVLIIVPPLLGLSPTREASLWAGWFYQAMAFLTAASPCALAIGTPAAILSGIGRAASAGVLIKGGVHLENLGRVSVIAFDKTGTLTPGRPTVTNVISFVKDFDEAKLLTTAAAIERGSQHPLALTIVAEARAREYPRLSATSIEQAPGMGIKGRVNNQSVMIGRLGMLDASHTHQPSIDTVLSRVRSLESQGKTVMIVAVEGQVVGAVAMVDQPRQGAAEMIKRLKQLGIRKTIMLTGDNAGTAEAVAQAVRVDESFAELLPEDKLKIVQELDQRFGRVAMVGDGINDAPAMANATVGIAIGGASGTGSDVALETADIALLANDLNKLPEAISVSRFTRRIILQNLTLALGVILILAPLAALGQTTIYASVMFHEGSTLLVVLNALRILRHQETRPTMP